MIGSIRRRILGGLSSEHRAGLMGIGWGTFSQLCVLTLRLGSTIILTRLLAPEVYGVFGTAMGVLVVLDWLSDLGINQALRRHAEGGTDRFLYTGWLMGLVRGGVVSLVVLALAPLVGWFHGQSILWPVMSVLGVRSLIYALHSPRLPILYRELNYRALFVLEVGQTFLGISVTILIAISWPSIWAFVIGILVGELTQVLLSYLLYPSRLPFPPGRWADRVAMREIRAFGSQILLNTLVFALWVNFERVFGLRLVGEAPMGLYIVAITLASVVEMLIHRVCDVYFGVLTREPDAAIRFQWHRRVCHYVARYGMPILAVGAMLAPLVVKLIYDDRYEAAGILFSWLLVRQMIRTLAMVQFPYLMARAEVYLATRSYVVALIIQAVLFWPLTASLGTLGMAFSTIASVSGYTLAQSWWMWRRGIAEVRPLFETFFWAALTSTALVMIHGIR